MLKVSYHVVSSVTGFMKHFTTMGPTLDANFCHGFISLCIEI